MKLSIIRRLLFTSLFFCLGFITSFTTQAEVAVPNLNARITDLTNTLSAEQISHIEQKLTTLEKTEGSQLVVLIIPTTKPEAMEVFSFRVVDKWKLGRKKPDDGVLLLIAKDDRKMRIEVGDGLEGCKLMEEHFRAGHFGDGAVKGIEEIGILLEKYFPVDDNDKNELSNKPVIL